MESFGKWAFVLGVLIAFLAGFVEWSWMISVLVGLGLIVGFLNISTQESERFLIATVALLIIGTAGISALFSTGSLAGTTQAILNNFVSFVAAAALVVALKTILTVESNGNKK